MTIDIPALREAVARNRRVNHGRSLTSPMEMWPDDLEALLDEIDRLRGIEGAARVLAQLDRIEKAPTIA